MKAPPGEHYSRPLCVHLVQGSINDQHAPPNRFAPRSKPLNHSTIPCDTVHRYSRVPSTYAHLSCVCHCWRLLPKTYSLLALRERCVSVKPSTNARMGGMLSLRTSSDVGTASLIVYSIYERFVRNAHFRQFISTMSCPMWRM